MRRGSFALVLLALTACRTPFKIAIEQAEQALLRNDLAEAARQYLIACRIDPDEKKVCDKAKNLTTEVVQKAVEDASLALGKGDIDYALDLIAPARRISTDPRLFQIAENAGDALAERCAAPENELILKAAEVRCLESRHRKVAVQKYTDLIGTKRDEAAALMLARAKDEKFPTLASTLRDVALCTAKASIRKEERDSGERRMLDAVSIPFALKVKATGLGDATDVLQGGCAVVDQRKAARCVKQTKDGIVSLQLDASVSDLSHTVQDDRRSVRYVAGIDRVPNPRYKELKHKLRRLEDELSTKRSRASQAQGRCSGAQGADRDRLCQDASAAQSDARSTESDRDHVESELRNTPEQIDQERWEYYNYTARVHQWWVDFTLRIARDGAEPQAATGRLDYGGEDRVGFAPAKVTASVARAPTFRDFANDLYPREADLIRAAVRDVMLERAKATEDSCGTSDGAFFWPWLDCHLRAALYSDGATVAPFWRAVEAKMFDSAREAPEYPCE